jgi:hypothetical protein
LRRSKRNAVKRINGDKTKRRNMAPKKSKIFLGRKYNLK